MRVGAGDPGCAPCAFYKPEFGVEFDRAGVVIADVQPDVVDLFFVGMLQGALGECPGDSAAAIDRFQGFAADGLVTLESDRLTVTPLGRFFLRNLCGTLDAYRAPSDGSKRFSRAV